MSDTVIKVENLSKKYIIGHQPQERYTTLRDSISNGAKGLLKPFQRDRSQNADPSSEDFWALKDVSFEIKQGDRVGIIGRNGAGKSTLLKILSRITEPTKGSIKIKGRVASLLEVGTGFHPELTGRENIFLNGAILGMGKEETKRKFDEIVAFAQVEKFLDTPVKRYSSGMYVRLAFAVAAHLEPEILIIDEVLAVGDADFQKKCLGRMEDIAEKEGKTIIFVSHNMTVIEHLCNKGIFLDRGSVGYTGDKEKAIQLYLSFNSSYNTSDGAIFELPEKDINYDEFQVLKVQIIDSEDRPIECVRTWDDLTIRIHYNSPREVVGAGIVIHVRSQLGAQLAHCSTQPLSGVDMSLKQGISSIDCVINQLPLSAGQYILGVNIAIPFVEDLYSNADIASLDIFPKDIYNSEFHPRQSYAPIALDYSWSFK